jgi:hypothetical protein
VCIITFLFAADFQCLQVFGSADDPIIKLCDLGIAKRRTEAPQYGPVSGTKEWQVGSSKMTVNCYVSLNV